MPLNLPFQPEPKEDVSPSLVPNRGPYYRGDYNPETLQNYWLHHYQAQQAMQPTDKPPLASYWEQPQIISRYYNLLRTAPPDWQPPDWLDTNKITAVYDYMKERYKDIPTAEWKPLPYDDPAADIMRSMPLPTYQSVMPSEYKYLNQAALPGAQNNVLTDAQVKAQQPIDWNDLDNPEYKWMRTYLSLFAPQAEGIENRPERSKLSASAVQSIMLGLGVGVTVGAVSTPIAGIIAGLGAAGLLTYQSYTGNKVPLLNDIMRPFNWLAEGAEATIGMASLAKQEGYDEVFDSLEDAYRTGLLEYETWKASNIPNWFAKTADVFRPNVDITTADKNEVWKISSGNLKPVEAPHGKGGEALAYYHKWIESGQANDEYQAALETGYDGRYQEFIYQRVMEEYGDTAISNDIVWQTVLDPLNVVPWAIGKTGGGIAGKIAATADNATTARIAGQIEGVFKQNTGNILIDALPPGIQQIAEAITKVQSSKGLLQDYKLYQDWIRTGFMPANLKRHAPDLQAKYKELLKDGVKQTDIELLDDTLTWTDKRGVKQSWQGKQGATIEIPKLEELSDFERYVAGIDDAYGYKDMIPTKGMNYFQKLIKRTPESQVLESLSNFHNNLDSLLAEVGDNPEKMIEYIEKLAGIRDIEKTDVLAGMMNGAKTRTFQSALKYALDDKDFLINYLSVWTTGADRRNILYKIAQAIDPDPKKPIGKKVAETVELLKNKPEVISQQLNKIAPEMNTDVDVLKATLDIFKGEDALPWSFELFKTNLISTIAKKMDDFYKDTYGLKPDSWVFRVSNVMKGVQSLVLLGFNPAYLMNNWVNNLVTRSVDGVGGYMSPKQIANLYERIGVLPRDSGLSSYDEITGAVIKQAMEVKDILNKVQRGVSKVNKGGVFSVLSGKIEKLEGLQAKAIATTDFLSKTKRVGVGIRRMPLVLENALDTRYPGMNMKEKVYAAADAGLNMKEIENSLFSTEVKPQIENLINQLDKRYSTGGKGSPRELFDKMNLTDNLRDELMNAKTDMDIDVAFRNVEERLTDWIEKAHEESLNHRAEEVGNIVDSEKGVAILQIYGDMAIDHASQWIGSRVEWERLYSYRNNGQITDAQFKKLANELNARQLAQIRRFNEYQTQTIKGVISKLGIETDYTRKIVIGAGELEKARNDFWELRNKSLKKYYNPPENKKITWEQIQDEIDDAYDVLTKAEHDIQVRLDANFVKAYADYTGWDTTRVQEWRDKLLSMNDERVEMQKAQRIKTRKMETQAEKDMSYAIFNPKYNQFIAQIKTFEHDGAYELMNKPVPQAEIPIPEVKNPAVDEMIVNEAKSLLKNQGVTDKQVNELLPDQGKGELEPLPEAIKPVEKMKEVVKAKIVADDIFTQADRVLKEKANHAELVRNKADYLEQTRKAYKNVPEYKIALFEKFSDRVIDQWAIRNGYTPSDEIRNAWYATRINKVESATGEVGAGALESAPKGSYQVMEDAGAVIRAFESADFSTMVHEMFHVWLPDLSDADFDIVAKLGGLKNGAELRDLEGKFRSGELVKGMEDYDRYVNTVEQFARGGEKYLADGDAPTPALKSLFRRFSDWMLEIYQALTRKNGRVIGYENTPLKPNINVKMDGVSLKDVFDRMLTDKVDRPKSITDIIRERMDTLKNERRYRRLDEQGIQTAAGKQVAKDILGTYKSADEAMKAADAMTDYVRLADGSLVDDAVIYDALDWVNSHPDTNPWTSRAIAKVESPVKEGEAVAYTPKGDVVHTKYAVVDLDELEASDNWNGNTVEPNPNYDQTLQGRIRNEKSSIAWMMDKSKPETFRPDLILDDFKSTDRGTPIIVNDNMVWSGNGRVNALRYGMIQDLGTYDKYSAELPKYAAQYGIAPDQYADMKHPILVRVITDEVTPEVLEKWAADSNKGSSASMSDYENAVNEGAKITDEALRGLEVGDTESIEGALLAKRNESFIRQYLLNFDEEAQKEIAYNLQLTEKGIKRIINALLSKVFQGASGETIVRLITNGENSLVKNNLKTLKDTLPQLASLDGKINTGLLDDGLRISDDLAKAVDVLNRIRENKKQSVTEYINTVNFVPETTPFQNVILQFLDDAKPTEARQTIRNYVTLAMKEPDPRQMDMFGDTPTHTKEELWNDARNIGKQEAEQIDARIATDSKTTEIAPELREQPIDTGTREGTGGLQPGSETVQRVVGEEPQPAVKQPWEMTREEYESRRDLGKPEYVKRKAQWEALQKILRDNNKKGMVDGLINREQWTKFTEKYGIPDTVSSDLFHFFDDAGHRGIIVRAGTTTEAKQHWFAVDEALAHGKPVPPEVLKDYPDLIAKNVISTQAKADYDAGQPVPIDRAQDIDLTHEEVMAVPEEVQKVINYADLFKFEQKQRAKDFVQWLIDGEKGIAPDVDEVILATFHDSDIETLREFAAQKARGVPADTTLQPEVKQTWEMTKNQYEIANDVDISRTELARSRELNKWKKMLADPEVSEDSKASFQRFIDRVEKENQHVQLRYEAIKKAITEGKAVPEDVLVDYPDLQRLDAANKKGIYVQRAYSFKHGNVDCIANVYKDGELIAYVPLDGLKDARLDENTRILGLDPQFPDKVVYEQDGVIKTVDSRKPEVDSGQDALFQNAETRTDTPEFKTWFSWDWINNRPGNKPSAVVNPDGTPMTVYHGSARIDRIAAKSKFDKNRATSGPMAFFTTDPEIGSKYAVGKQDTSLANTDFNFEDGFLFKMPGNRYKDNLRTLWYSLDDATKKNLSENLPKAMHETTHLENIMYDEGLSQEVRDSAKARHNEIFDSDPLVLGEGVAGLDHWNYVLKNEARGNPIIAAMKIWLEGGDFIGEERRFLEVLRTAGLNTLPMKVETNLGNEVAQGVVPVHLSVSNPLETHAIPASVIDALRTRANKTRHRASEYGADAWDKNTRDPKEWVAELEKDISENTDHVWTSIPDWVTETLKEQGYDGIHDRGGKYSGFVHDVWIPFYEAQVKSTFNRGTYDPKKSNMLYQSGQTDFFSQTADDLPLFSGTPMKAEDMLFAPKEASPQMSMFPDIVPEAKPTRIIEIQVRENGGTSYIRLDLRKTKAIRDTLALHKGEEMTARILDANGKVVRSNVDPNEVVSPTLGNALFQAANTATKDWYFSQLGKVLEGMPNKMTPEALRGFLNGKVKPSEMEWTGFEKWISQQEGQITKQDALDYIAENQVRVEEVSKGAAHKNIAWDDSDPNNIVATTGNRTYKIVKNEIGEYEIYADTGQLNFMDTSLVKAKEYLTKHILRPQLYPTKFGTYTLPGGVEQFREYNEAPIDVQRMSDAPMGEVPLNGTPITEPFSRTLDEINSETLRPMMDELKGMYKKAMKEDTPFKFGDLTDADKKAIRKYLDNDVRSDLASVKRAALSYGDMMRNNAMLDYGRRYGFDNVLGTVFPYQFWYTRSMMNWAKRMVDKPSWFAMYARMKQTQERMEQENMPTRLRGKMRINMPWMPEWMGGGLWTDPMSKVFPFQQFGQPFEQYAMNKNQLNKAAEYIIEDMRSSEKISIQEAEQAISTKQGTIWERALAQAEIEEGKSSSPASLVGMMMQPALWWQIPLNMANENRQEVGPLPITRTGQTIKELGRNTFLQPVTNLVGGALAAPETAIRKSKGLSEFGQWGDYYIDRTIAGMAADGEITAEQARIAMIQRTGDVFAEATNRVSQEQALRTPGAAGFMALKEGKVGQALPAFIGSMFGGSLFSEGELKMRGLKPVFDNAWRKYEAGDDEAINQFFEDYPEYEARLALYDEPEDRLHQFLIDSIWRKYMALDKENKRMAVDALGEDFELSFLDKETRSYETISDKTLAQWSQMLGKSEMPEVEAVQGAEKAPEISYYDQQLLKAINAYKTEKESRFKNTYVWQEAYFNLPVGAQRKAFLQQHPDLKAYWEWKDEYARTHPEIAPYFQELKQSSTGDQASSELTSPLIRQVLTLATGGTLSAGAKNELERIRMQIAPDMTEEQFIQIVLSLVLSGGGQ